MKRFPLWKIYKDVLLIVHREDDFIRKIMSKIFWNIFIIWNFVFEYQRIKFENFSNTSEIKEYYIIMKKYSWEWFLTVLFLNIVYIV